MIAKTIRTTTMIPTIPSPPTAASMCLPSDNRSIARLGSQGESRCGAPTFTGYGPRFHFSNHDKFQLGPATCLFHDRGVFREAPTVSGTITGLVEPIGTPTFSKISDQSSTALSHGGECSR